VGPRATHFSGYCCVGLMWGISDNTLYWVLLVYVGAAGDTLQWVLLLAYVGPQGNTLNWVLLVYVAPRATHFTGYCCWFIWGIVVGYVAPRTTHILGIVVNLRGASGNTL
jgi:hypothetical protein